MAKSVFFFGMSRGGSSITFQIIQKILLSSGYRHHDPEGDAYRAKSFSGLTHTLESLAEKLATHDALVGPFRNNNHSRLKQLSQLISSRGDDALCVIVTRDPIDCLHSWYYARHLHPGWKNEDVNDSASLSDFALQLSGSYLKEVEGLMAIANSFPSVHYAYQDIVFGPSKWLRDCLAVLSVSPPLEEMGVINSLMSFLSPYEISSLHRRSGLPGFARKILDAGAIDQIDIAYHRFNEYFRYPRPAVSEQVLDLAYELSSLRDSLKLLMAKNGQLTGMCSKLSKEVDQLRNIDPEPIHQSDTAE